MAIKYTFLGLLIYLTIAAYLFAFLATITGKKKTGQVIYLMGFIAAAAAFAYRWHDVRHVPFQNMFEVFLSMGIFVYPLSIFCRRLLRVSGEAVDMLIGVILLFPAGFVFHAEPQMLPPALQSWLFMPHVAVYLISYVIMVKAAIQAFCYLKDKTGNTKENLVGYEEGTYRMICFGFPLLTLGLILGSWWGKLAWGDYWGWDPKELWSLVSWLVYVGYFHVRYMFGQKHARLNSSLAILGLAAIVITLLWVNLSRIFPGLHSYAG
ncbi:MAG: cytochrome c biogenesis protein CcsA [Phycisphaerae bacterium]|jgi:ABC-type transport system involved in cytochrome c biogenesis permease subunit